MLHMLQPDYNKIARSYTGAGIERAAPGRRKRQAALLRGACALEGLSCRAGPYKVQLARRDSTSRSTLLVPRIVKIGMTGSTFFRSKVGSGGFEKVLIGTRGARETFLRGRKGRAAKNSVLTSGVKQLKC